MTVKIVMKTVNVAVAMRSLTIEFSAIKPKGAFLKLDTMTTKRLLLCPAVQAVHLVQDKPLVFLVLRECLCKVMVRVWEHVQSEPTHLYQQVHANYATMTVSLAIMDNFVSAVLTLTSEYSTTQLADAFLSLVTMTPKFLSVSPVLQVVLHANHQLYAKDALVYFT